MNPETFAEWMRRQGRRVIQTASSYWYDAGPGVLQAFPYHWLIQPDEDELHELMLRHGVGAVRYSAPLDFRRGAVSYHVVLREPYTLDLLKAQARNGVKAGMGQFRIQQISFERLAAEGWVLQEDTLARQGRLRSMTKETWEKLCLAAVGLPGFEAWAALSGDELASAIIVAQHGSVFSVPFAMSHRRFLGDHVNSALFYCTAKELLQREGVDSLFYTVQSLDAPPQVDEFKFRLGLQPKLVRQCVEFHPLLAPLATAQVHRWVQSWARWDSQNPFPAKAEGMLRFHLEGKKPLAEQAWPERLQKERDRLNPRPAILAKKGGIEVALATPFDVNELVDLHAHCFSWREHWPVQLGRPFLLAIYRWFTTSPGTHVLVARKAGRILGFTTLSDRPYNLPMLRACMPELIRACLRRPWVMLNPELFARYVRMVTGRGREDGDKRVAQIAFTGVDLSARGTGVAQILKAASLDLCRKQGMAAVITGVRRHNQPARQLNERAGFVEIPRLSTRKLVYLRLDLENPLSASGPLS